MSSGLVYLRPARAHFVREGAGAERDEIQAWTELWNAISGATLADEDVVRLFGLRWPSGPDAKDAGKERYDVGAEFSDAVAFEEFTALRTMSVPGGTFVRGRHRGPLQEIPDAISDLRENAGKISSFRPDDTRPVIEIHLKWSTDPFTTECSELLVPIVAKS